MQSLSQALEPINLMIFLFPVCTYLSPAVYPHSIGSYPSSMSSPCSPATYSHRISSAPKSTSISATNSPSFRRGAVGLFFGLLCSFHQRELSIALLPAFA